MSEFDPVTVECEETIAVREARMRKMAAEHGSACNRLSGKRHYGKRRRVIPEYGARFTDVVTYVLLGTISLFWWADWASFAVAGGPASFRAKRHTFRLRLPSHHHMILASSQPGSVQEVSRGLRTVNNFHPGTNSCAVPGHLR